jgi:predicted permease
VSGGAWQRVRRLWRRSVREEVDEELRLHLELRAEELEAGGLSPEAARAEALRRFGDVERVRRACEGETAALRREDGRREAWAGVLGDVRFAWRTFRQAPTFTLVVVLTLALGIGATTAVFSVVHGVLLQPPPYAAPDRLVVLKTVVTAGGGGNLSDPELRDFQTGLTTVTHLGGHASLEADLTEPGEQPQRVKARRVSVELVEGLGVRPLHGRLFAPEEGKPDGGHRVVLLSHALWQARFGGDAGVVGRSVELGGNAHRVVGVMPPGFVFGDAQLWVPLAIDWANNRGRGSHYMSGVGRLAPGATLEQARAEARAVAARLVAEYPENYPEQMGFSAAVEPLRTVWEGGVRPVLLVLLAAVAGLLLIACANVASLLLSRGLARGRELSVRAALGAGRGRLVRQLLTESLLLALAGGALGVLFARLGVDALLAAASGSVPHAERVGVDGQVLSLAVGLSVLCGLLFGLLPALQATREGAGAGLTGASSAGGRSATAGRSARRTQGVLVVVQVALAVCVMATAGLLLRSYWELQRVELGFRPERTLAFELTLPAARYPDKARVAGFYTDLMARLAAHPEVEAVGASSWLPLSGHMNDWVVEVEGRPRAPGEDPLSPDFSLVTAGYLEAIGIPVLRGQPFTAEDEARPALDVVLVNQTLAERLWPGEDPLGKRMRPDGGELPWLTVKGVVRDVRAAAPHAPPRPAYYMLHAQGARSGIAIRGLAVVVRTRSAPLALADWAREQVWAADPSLAVAGLRTVEDLTAEALARRRFTALLLAVFAGTALLLAAVGLHGVMALAVSQRRRELGIRLALGATPGTVRRLVLGQGLRLTLGGLLLGGVLALGAGRAVEGLLYGVRAADPLTFGGLLVLLAGVALLACWAPARRATGVDPGSVLRSE